MSSEMPTEPPAPSPSAPSPSAPAPPAVSRSGTYVRQPEGYAAFVPSPLPPDPPIEFDGELQACLSNADRALGRLDGSIQTLPNPDLFVFMYVRKEAVLSSQIEGTESSINDVLEARPRCSTPTAPRTSARCSTTSRP